MRIWESIKDKWLAVYTVWEIFRDSSWQVKASLFVCAFVVASFFTVTFLAALGVLFGGLASICAIHEEYDASKVFTAIGTVIAVAATAWGVIVVTPKINQALRIYTETTAFQAAPESRLDHQQSARAIRVIQVCGNSQSRLLMG
ncbi:hypothetical protein, partial [Aureimonas sp. SK2]|uniref:hypothetical protein n=1 Tax=Aureimonas sp. SK2 TaxID=3015992 RepID=UPI00244462F2